MKKEAKTSKTRLREIWSFHVEVGRFSLFVGLGEVRRTS